MVEYTPPGRMRSHAEFAARWAELAPDLGCDERVVPGGALSTPLAHRGRSLRNRFAVLPMEGWDALADGMPSPHTVRRWNRFGQSGAKLIWGGEAFAVQEDGRASANQLFCNPTTDAARGLATLRGALRDGHRSLGEDPDELFVGLQLTHSGRFARPAGVAAPRIAAHHPILDARVGADAAALLSDAELEAIGENFVGAARLAAAEGFDFVDVKCCHGYLLHELLAARGRPGPYGGTLQGRTRLLRRIITEISTACPTLEVGVRLSLGDRLPYERDAATGVGRPMAVAGRYECGFGIDAEDPSRFDLDEPFTLLGWLQELGVTLINVTLGSPYYCPHLQRPAAYPPSDGYRPPHDPLLDVATHLRAVRACRRAFPGLLLVGTGYSYLQEHLGVVAQHEVAQGHVDFVGLGRMMLAYPDLPRDLLAGREPDRKRLCRTLSDCTTAPRNGLPSGCYPLDEFYKRSAEAEILRARKQ